MTPKPEVVRAALDAIERASEHPRILAAKAVAEYRGEVENAPKINQHDDKGGHRLDVDRIESAARPGHAPKVEIKRRRRRWWR